MSHHRVHFHNVHFRYEDGTEALHGVSFTLAHGESVGLVGANGSGKSTLLGHLCGQHLASAGAVEIGHLAVTASTVDAVRRGVGLLFQDPDDQLFMPTVLEDVAFGPLNQGLDRAAAEIRALEALRTVGCEGLVARAPHHLSLGQRSAVAVACVLAMEPDVLALDEPAARLDPRARRRLMELLRGFAHTKIIASHDLDLVLELCDRVLLLDQGRLVADGPARRILSDASLLQAHGLELPLSLQGPGPHLLWPRRGAEPAPSLRTPN